MTGQPKRTGRPPRAEATRRTMVDLSLGHLAKAVAIGQAARGNAAPLRGDVVAGIRAAIDAHPLPATPACEVRA